MMDNRRSIRWELGLGLYATLVLPMAGPAVAQGCLPVPDSPRIEITGTSLGKDNIYINPNDSSTWPTIYWTPYSLEPAAWGCSAAFILDDLSEGYNYTISAGLGGSGCPFASPFQGFYGDPSWTYKSCKHTLKIRAYFRVNGICDNSFFLDSNPITLWMDDNNSSVHEDQDVCTGGAPICEAPTIAYPVNVANGRMHHEMTDLRIDGPLPIEFSRRYDSGSTDDGPMGYGWQHSYMMRLTELSSVSRKTLIDRDMRRVSFNCGVWTDGPPAACNEWDPDTLNHLTLEESPGSEPRWHVTNKHKTVWDFDSSGRLVAITDRNGNTVTLTYPSSPKRLIITDGFGRALTVDYDASGTYIDQVSAGGRTVAYEYSDGNLTSVTHSDQTTFPFVFVTYTYYPSSHRFHTATDANGNVIESHEYTDGRVTHTESQGGNYAYDIDYVSATQTTVRNARETPVTTTFTILPHRGVVTDRTGGPGCSSCNDSGDATHKVYDAWLKPEDVTDGKGVTTHREYDGMGNVLELTEAEGTSDERTTTYTYHEDWNFVETVSVPKLDTSTCTAPARLTTFVYDDLTGDLESETVVGCNGDDLVTTVTEYTYDAHGQVLTINGPRTDVSDVTTYEYYADNDPDVNRRGRLHKIKNALNHETVFGNYDYFGNAQSVTDPNNVVTTRAFNFNDQVTEERIEGATDADDIVTKYVYDPVGNLDKVRLPKCVEAGAGCAFSFDYGYDGVNRLTSIEDARGNRIIYSYDREGNRNREEYKDSSSATKHEANLEYDNYNRLQRICHAPPNPTTCGSVYDEYTYWEDGLLKIERDPMNHSTTYLYDGLKRRTKASQMLGTTAIETIFGYDKLDGLSRVTDPRGLVTNYVNNDLGWRLQTISPDTGETSYEYDKAGNLTGTLDANLIEVTRQYDELNRLTGIGHPTRTDLNVAYSYDETWAPNGIGRRTGMVDSGGQSAFFYDPRGLLTHEIRAAYGLSAETGYDYDKNGNLTEIRYPAIGSRQNRVNYIYDVADRVSEVTTEVDLLTGERTIADEFGYLPFGPRTGMRFGSGLLDTRTFDTRYQLDTWTLGSLINYDHSFDDDGNLIGRTIGSATDRAFGYDSIHRLTHATGPWCGGVPCPTTTYSYDKDGNRESKNEGTGVAATSYFYTPGTNRLASTSGGELASYSYDANGNTTANATHTFEYSEANRLESVDGGFTASYTYDGDNRRAIKSVGFVPTYYFYDPSGRLLTEVKIDNEFARFYGKDYVYLHGAPVARVDWWMNIEQGFMMMMSDPIIILLPSETLSFYHTDHLGTPIMMTSESSVPMWKAEYLPFGNLAPGEPSVNTIENNLRFPGQYFDGETGLHQNWLRTYAPATGRYAENDPIGLSDGTNLYGYVGQNPLNFIDPYGLLATPVSTGVGCALGGPPGCAAGAAVGGGIDVAASIGATALTASLLLSSECPDDDDPCTELLDKILREMNEINRRVSDLLADRLNLYVLANKTRNPMLPPRSGTYQGHINQVEQRQVGLRRLISQAERKGCPIPPAAYRLATLSVPTKPLAVSGSRYP